MEAKDSFTLTWCVKHNNWWVTNCPDCMVDDKEQSIKREGIREVVDVVNPIIEYFCDWIFQRNWQAKLKDWGL